MIPVLELTPSGLHTSSSANVFRAVPCIQCTCFDKGELSYRAKIISIPAAVSAICFPMPTIRRFSLTTYMLQGALVNLIGNFYAWRNYVFRENIKNAELQWNSSMQYVNQILHGRTEIRRTSTFYNSLQHLNPKRAQNLTCFAKLQDIKSRNLLWLLFFHIASSSGTDLHSTPRVTRVRASQAIYGILHRGGSGKCMFKSSEDCCKELLRLNCNSSMTMVQFEEILVVLSKSKEENKSSEYDQMIIREVISFCQLLYVAIIEYVTGYLISYKQEDSDKELLLLPNAQEILKTSFYSYYKRYDSVLRRLFAVATDSPPVDSNVNRPRKQRGTVKLTPEINCVSDNVLVIEGNPSENGDPSHKNARFPDKFDKKRQASQSLNAATPKMSYNTYSNLIDCTGLQALGVSNKKKYISFVLALLHTPERHCTREPVSALSFTQFIQALGWLSVLMGTTQFVLSTEERISMQLYQMGQTLADHLSLRGKQVTENIKSQTFSSILRNEVEVMKALASMPVWEDLSLETQSLREHLLAGKENITHTVEGYHDLRNVTKRLLQSTISLLQKPIGSRELSIGCFRSSLFGYWLQEAHQLRTSNTYHEVLVFTMHLLTMIGNTNDSCYAYSQLLHPKLQALGQLCEEERYRYCLHMVSNDTQSETKSSDTFNAHIGIVAESSEDMSVSKNAVSRQGSVVTLDEKERVPHEEDYETQHFTSQNKYSFTSRQSFCLVQSKLTKFPAHRTAMLQSLMQAIRRTPELLLDKAQGYMVAFVKEKNPNLEPQICALLDIVNLQCTWVDLKTTVFQGCRTQVQRSRSRQSEPPDFYAVYIQRINKLLEQIATEYTLFYETYIAQDASLGFRMSDSIGAEIQSNFAQLFEIMDQLLVIQEDKRIDKLSDFTCSLVAYKHRQEDTSWINRYSSLNIDCTDFQKCDVPTDDLETATEQLAATRMELLPSSPVNFLQVIVKEIFTVEFSGAVREFHSSTQCKALRALLLEYNAEDSWQSYAEFCSILSQEESSIPECKSGDDSLRNRHLNRSFGKRIKALLSRSSYHKSDTMPNAPELSDSGSVEKSATGATSSKGGSNSSNDANEGTIKDDSICRSSVSAERSDLFTREQSWCSKLCTFLRCQRTSPTTQPKSIKLRYLGARGRVHSTAIETIGVE